MQIVSYKSVIYTLLVILIWSFGWILTKVGLDHMPPFTFAALRFVIAAVLMLLIASIKYKCNHFSRKEWCIVILVGLTQTTLMFTFINIGMQNVSVGKASILIYSMPIWSAVLAYLFLQEPLKAKDILILCFGIIGVYFVFVPGISIESDIFGLFLLLLSAISWAVSNILVKKYFAKHNKFVLTTWQMLFGSVGLVALSFWFENPLGLSLNYIEWGILLYTSIFASVVAFTLWFSILPSLNVMSSTMPSLLIPFFVIMFDSIFLEQSVTVSVAMGLILIALSCILTALRK
ncbi:DMT family transporter [Photorhabdus heterorhabditis]|uniref:Threonine/homoserine exporter RhtA n=1 Tax=Photorhabdus heterorhabditis TaxID=880156 RepID=A0A5B0WDF2_9GAMM|nr:DMT family transporter [Photorhabdus heterorhabditis]KAA1184355.1 DMT family transporter [Photorhabdus heterorhabditis]